MSGILKFNQWVKINEADPGTETVQPAVPKPVDQMTQAEKDMAQITNWARDKGQEVLQSAMKQDELNTANRVISILKEAAGGKTLGKNVINIKGNTQLQVFLKKLGVLKSKAGPLGDGVTCYFNGETETALKTLCGLDQLDFSNAESMNTFAKSWVNRPEVLDLNFNKALISERVTALEAKKPQLELGIDTGLLTKYYNTSDYKNFEVYNINLTGNILDDMYKFNSVKEGGLSDDPADSGPAASPCPYEFDARTGKLTYNGTTHQLKLNSHLQSSVSIINGGSSSNRWHTSRGVVWPTWKTAAAAMGITDPLMVAKGFFEMTDENARQVYELTFYNPQVKDKGLETISPLVNHCMGTAFWGSLLHGGRTIAGTTAYLKEMGYSSLNDAIQKIGDKTVTEAMLLVQIDLYEDYAVGAKAKYRVGWVRGLLNFHKLFVPVYADLPSQEKFPEEYAKRQKLNTAGFSGLAQFA